MYRHVFTPLLLVNLALAMSQTDGGSALPGLPACAQNAANTALGSSGCAANDKNCICSSQPFIAAITTAITQTCTAQDVQAALTFAQTYCGAALGSGSSSSAPAATGDGATSSSAPTSSPTATDDDDAYNGVSTTTVPGTVTSTASISGATPTGTMSGSTIPSSSNDTMAAQCTNTTTVATTAAKTSSYGSTFTGAAAKNIGQGRMAAVAGVAGAIALL